jgi:hypothetical protein
MMGFARGAQPILRAAELFSGLEMRYRKRKAAESNNGA